MDPSRILLIIGSAPCAKEDLAALPVPVESCDVCLVGLDAVDIYLGHADYLATYHPAEIAACTTRRAAAGGNTDWTVISHLARPGVNLVVPATTTSGSSSHLAAMAGVKLGYGRMILAGCPLTGANGQGHNYDIFRKGWEKHRDLYGDRVRSMSGWTREFLGAPPEGWHADQG